MGDEHGWRSSAWSMIASKIDAELRRQDRRMASHDKHITEQILAVDGAPISVTASSCASSMSGDDDFCRRELMDAWADVLGNYKCERFGN